MITLMQQGGWIFWVILAAGVVASVVFLESGFHVHRARIKTDDFLRGICNVMRRRNVAEALSICEETPGPIASMVRSAVLHHDKGRDMIERVMNDVALIEISRMERRFAILATIAQVALLLGLLGTVMGMIETYMVIQQKAPLIHVGDLAGGIWQSMIATAAGLVVAIFSYAGYNMLVGKVHAIALDMERTLGEMLGFLAGSGTLLAEEDLK